MDPQYDVDDHESLDATARFRCIAETSDTGSHRYSQALGDAVADIGKRLHELTNIVTGVRITQARHVDRDEVAKIAKEANGKLEGQLVVLTRLVWTVAVGIPVAVFIDWAIHHLS